MTMLVWGCWSVFYRILDFSYGYLAIWIELISREEGSESVQLGSITIDKLSFRHSVGGIVSFISTN